MNAPETQTTTPTGAPQPVSDTLLEWEQQERELRLLADMPYVFKVETEDGEKELLLYPKRWKQIVQLTDIVGVLLEAEEGQRMATTFIQRLFGSIFSGKAESLWQKLQRWRNESFDQLAEVYQILFEKFPRDDKNYGLSKEFIANYLTIPHMYLIWKVFLRQNKVDDLVKKTRSAVAFLNQLNTAKQSWDS